VSCGPTVTPFQRLWSISTLITRKHPGIYTDRRKCAHDFTAQGHPGIVTQRFGIRDRRYAPARANEAAVLRGRLAGLRREGPVNPPCSAASTGMETRATIAVIAAIFFMMCSPFVLIWLLLPGKT
jgi:hypothetical protein